MAINEPKLEKRSKRLNSNLRLLAIALVLAALNFIGDAFFFQLDLTADKRYTLTDATKETLAGLPDLVFVDVYLEGDFPAGFERLQKSIRETLENFRSYSGSKLQYRFVDPGANLEYKARAQFMNDLVKRGLQPTNLNAEEEGKRTEKIIFPGAIVKFGTSEVPVQLLKGNMTASPEQRLNQSVEGVEFELISAIKSLTQKQRKKIALVRGHGELNDYEMTDFINSLRLFYDVKPIDLPKELSLDGYDLAIVAKPLQPWSEPDKFKLDQFIIRGGSALFVMEALKTSIDSIREEGYLALPVEHNLDDMLFRYGIRHNKDVALDVMCAPIPLVVGYLGDRPNTQLVPWRYYPALNTFGTHPITKNMDAVITRFVSTLDTVTAPGIKKTLLLTTSKYARIIPGPLRLTFNEARLDPDPKLYNKAFLPLGWVLEGKFQSLYTNRLAPHTEQYFKFQAQGKPAKIAVYGDGDLAKNDFNYRAQQAYPLGYDRFSQTQFANKDLLMNTVSYLLDPKGTILARKKTIELRPLDRPKLAKEKRKWQTINLVAPAIAFVMLGVFRFQLRKKRYASFKA